MSSVRGRVDSGGTDRARQGRALRFGLLAIAVLLTGVLVWILLSMASDDLPPVGTGGLTFVREIVGPNEGDTPSFERPLSAAFAPDGSIYVADTGNRRVCRFTSEGRFLYAFGDASDQASGGENGAGQLEQPVDVAVASDGSVYVADLRARSVRVYDEDGRYLVDVRPRDSETARGWEPVGLAVDDRYLYVADGPGVLRFDRTAEAFADELRLPGVFQRATAVALGAGGTVVVSDALAKRVVAINPAGQVRWASPADGAPGQLYGQPRGVAPRRDGSWLVVDAFRFALIGLDADGNYLASYGGRGSAPLGFEYPNDVDARGDLVVVTDKENDRVQLLRFEGTAPAVDR